MSDPAVLIENLDKTYRVYKHPIYQMLSFLCPKMIPQSAYTENHALSDFSLNIPRGSKIGIIGKNGSGKSTLLKLISGRVQPTAGKLKVDGRVNALLELGTGFHPEFTGRENIFSALAYMGITGPDAAAKFDEIVDFSEIGNFIDQPVRVYSTGMYMRLAFSIATSIEPEILLVDEALSVGDTYYTNKCLDKMKQMSADGNTTVIYVSHNIRSLLHLCEKVVWLEKGRIRAAGAPVEILTAYDLSVREEEQKRMRAKTALNSSAPEAESIGSGGVRVDRVIFKDASNTEQHFFKRGEALLIEFGYSRKNLGEYESFSAVVGITRADGVLVTASLICVEHSETSGTVRVLFPSLFLNAGHYFVSVLIYKKIDLNEGQTRYYIIDDLVHDAKIRAYEFKVEGGYPIETNIFNHPVEINSLGSERLTLLNPLKL